MRYMGTKAALAPHLVPIILESKPDIFVDLFSGIGNVASLIAPSKQITCVDQLGFSKVITQARFSRRPRGKSLDIVLSTIVDKARTKMAMLVDLLSNALRTERELVQSRSASDLEHYFANSQRQLKHINGRIRACSLHLYRRSLFARRYSFGYFSLQQAIEIDAIRAAICDASSTLESEASNLLLAQLICVASRISNTTGHFAQYISANARNGARICAQFKRSPLEEFARLDANFETTAKFPKKNASLKGDAITLLKQLKPTKQRVAIYADPPYTKEQYFRYYHVLENLVAYEDFEPRGRGRYPATMPSSTFSLKSQVLRSFDQLISVSALRNYDLYISYPANGLLDNARSIIPQLMKRHYHVEPQVHVFNHQHSSLGSQSAKSPVQEFLFAHTSRRRK